MTQLKNYAEELVKHKVYDVAKELDMCVCEKCLLDITALALNTIKPKYVVSEVGELYSKVNSFENQFEVDVLSAIINAANIVKSKPKHD